VDDEVDGAVGAGDAGRDGEGYGEGDGVVTGPPTVPLPQRQLSAWRRGLSGRATRRGVRLDPGRPGAVALVLVAAVAAVVAAVGVWTARPQAEPVHGLPAVAVDAAPGAGGAAGADGAAGGVGAATRTAVAVGAPGVLVVSVAGRVARPGVVRVPDGARVADVLAAAGGAQPGVDLSGLNLARRVVDGEQIAVGVPPAPDAAGQPLSGGAAEEGPGVAAGPGAARPAAKIDLNTASVAQLDTLPGVGPVTAQHIVEWRSRNGRFVRVEQLREIDGIGERRFQQLRELVTV
jgi:competence protein ComEA